MKIARASIERRLVVLFLCLLVAVAGVFAYFRIGKLEDPTFTIKTAVVTAVYPGATAYEVESEVASRIEDAVQAMGEIKHIRSHCMPGMAIIYVDIKDKYTSAYLPQIWDVLRQKLVDVQPYMPAGCTVMINNDFGDVYGQYYALIGDGYTMKELWDYADFLKKQLVLVPNVASVKVLGEQSECVYVEFSTNRLSSLGISPQAIIQVLNQQNTLSAVGRTLQGTRFVRVSPTSSITTVDDIGDLVIGGAGGKLVRLREVATVRRDFADPQTFMLRFNGRPALGLGIATVPGGNVVEMGEAVTKCLRGLEVHRPIGMELEEIYMQSDQVTKSINDFIVNLAESLAIVVGVLLVFMGLRTGLLIGIVLLLTVAGTIAIMNACGIFLQMVSLAALIIALGSLVDNAIVVSEGMLVGVERGQAIEDAADDSVEGAKWAMLGGTFIAILAFAPIGFSQAQAGEYCRSLYQVVAISMSFSWVMALTATPVFGSLMLKPGKADVDPYNKPLFRAYRWLLEACLRHRLLTAAATLAVFAASVWGFTRLEQSFFPDANTAYYTVDLWGTEGRSLEATRASAVELESYLRAMPEVKNVTDFIGGGSLRFMLTYSPPDPNTAFSQLLVETKDFRDMRSVLLKTQKHIDEAMPGVSGICKPFSKGSGMTPRLEARFYGTDSATLRELAEKAKSIFEADPSHKFARLDWRTPVEVIRPRVMKDQMRNLGLTRPMINQDILIATTGLPIGGYRDGDKTLPILAVVEPGERYRMDRLKSFPIWAPTANATVPLGTVIASLDTRFEDNLIMRRDRSRVLTAATDTVLGSNADAMLRRVRPLIEAIPLPVGYSIDWGGEQELSNESLDSMKVAFAPALVLMFTVMVFLFNGLRQPLIIFASLPLILIGVVAGLAIAGMSVSFLAIVGLLSLVGMLAKNSIVLLDQVSVDFAAGRDRYEAIVEDGVGRLRPVSMSAITTVLGMIPLIPDLMFGPMAVTIMAGLTVSTVLTLIVIPVLTAMVYHVPCPKK
ncbi:MAG: efflux RND transporter permease subunit [Pyramidobacter sp.]|nr:efflux RND transporter permease subunit [Pyramidobacter sp.]